MCIFHTKSRREFLGRWGEDESERLDRLWMAGGLGGLSGTGCCEAAKRTQDYNTKIPAPDGLQWSEPRTTCGDAAPEGGRIEDEDDAGQSREEEYE